jgi:hypothetical protein
LLFLFSDSQLEYKVLMYMQMFQLI